MSRALILLSAALSLSACGPGELLDPDPPGVDTLRYVCAEGRSFDVVYRVAVPTVTVRVGGETRELSQVESNLGLAYANAGTRLTVLRDRATLTGFGGSDFTDCRGTKPFTQ